MRASAVLSCVSLYRKRSMLALLVCIDKFNYLCHLACLLINSVKNQHSKTDKMENVNRSLWRFPSQGLFSFLSGRMKTTATTKCDSAIFYSFLSGARKKNNEKTKFRGAAEFLLLPGQGLEEKRKTWFPGVAEFCSSSCLGD